MTMSNLKCSVDTCHYWGSGNQCTANGIEVKSQNEKAQNSDGTICQTFKPSQQ